MLQNEIPAVNPQTCDLLLSIEVGSNFAARIFIEGIAAGTALQDVLLRNPESRFMVKGPGGEAVVETLHCGSCTDIYDNTVGIVQPLETARRDALASERYRPKITRRFIIGNSCPLSRIGSLEASSTGKAEGASSKAVSQPIRHNREALAAVRIGV